MFGALPPVFAGLPQAYQDEAASFLTPITVEPGEAVMMEGEQDTTLAFIASGTCELWRGETKVGTAGAREMIGEVEVFAQLPRVCSATAVNRVHLQVLAPEAFAALAEAGNPVVYHLERAVLRRISERIAKLHTELAPLTRGAPFTVTPKQPSFVDKLASAFRKKPKAPDLDRAEVLRRSELFDWAPDALIQEIATQFDVERFEPEQILCRQGEDGTRMFLVASGAVEVVVPTGEGRAQPISTVGPGYAVGDAALGLSTPRTATCVTRDEVVALVLDRPRFRELYEADEAVSSAFRQGIVRDLILQLLPAMDRYVEATGAAANTEDGMYKGTPVNAMWRD